MLKEVVVIIGIGAGTAVNILCSSLSGLISNQSLTFVHNAKKRKTTATAKFDSFSFFDNVNANWCIESNRTIFHKAFSYLYKVLVRGEGDLQK
jgi:hypothetical protein